MPGRINRALELLEQGQPIYYTDSGPLTYDNGKAMARTWADYLAVDLEHGAWDLPGLGEFMRGLVDGGPTASGHRTPAVITTVPTDGTDEAVVRANAWMFKQVLARGVHGVLLCHAETAGAVRAFVESCRYPFTDIGVGGWLGQGRRGAGGQGYASAAWGISDQEYLEKADPWPLNPAGELLLGLKIENKRALLYADVTTAIPGVAFAEWGPGDMSMSLGYTYRHDAPFPDGMQAARSKVFSACKNSGISFLNGVREDDVAEMIDEGVMIGSCGTSGEPVARKGRAYTNRTMPV
ncbi:MAG: aldolase/citrate lyase family protein [Chloroflexi bacterium]|nr:aldolase/citrate lyase family protein [Chloroflexota bacterium]